uniref:UDP-N-acetylglucosamine transferase subunit ALG13 n=1 Tax=Globodera rostochiensis TaxID=31243 RepID=A0A914HCG8_GLORO
MSTNNSSSTSISSAGTTGIRVTRQRSSARINWLSELTTRDSTPISTVQQTSKEFSEICKQLILVEDEENIKRIQTKREKEAHERDLAFVKRQLVKSRKDDWLHQPIEELLGYTPNTRFDFLIEALFRSDVIDALKQLNIGRVTIQKGNGVIPAKMQSAKLDIVDGIMFHLFDYLPSIKEHFQNADLIIGHAGAGTCLEALECGKPFIAVINNSLMDNHQAELAEKLAEDGHLLFTTPNELAQSLAKPTLFKLKPFEKADPLIFRQFVENLVLKDL